MPRYHVEQKRKDGLIGIGIMSVFVGMAYGIDLIAWMVGVTL